MISNWYTLYFLFIAELLTSFAIRQSFLQEERTVTEELATISTVEAFRVEVLSNRVQAILLTEKGSLINQMIVIDDKSSYTHALDLAVALVACRRNEFLETVLAIELSFFLDKADVLKRTAALSVNADEMIGAPDLTQSGDERSSIIIDICIL